jgi:hypothetical protein
MILEGVTPQADPVDSGSDYKEKSFDEKPDFTPQYVDAFGNEENAEVKYKTMEWWYVSRIYLRRVQEADRFFLGKLECVCQN